MQQRILKPQTRYGGFSFAPLTNFLLFGTNSVRQRYWPDHSLSQDSG